MAIIRNAQQKDSEQLSQLMIEYISDFYKRPRPEQEKVKELIESLLLSGEKGLQFVAEESGELLGFATLYFTYSTLQLNKAAILNDLYVKASARGKGLGESLFTACYDYVKENGYAYMTWETAKDNTTAQKLYKKMGGAESDWLVYEIS